MALNNETDAWTEKFKQLKCSNYTENVNMNMQWTRFSKL